MTPAPIIPPLSARARFLRAVESRLGFPVLWGAKGPDAYDCSGLVTACLLEADDGVAVVDRRRTHRAQTLFDVTRPLGRGVELPGDLAFYGKSPDEVVHVAVVDGHGGVVSADGATSRITMLSVAIANPLNRVRRHAVVRCRADYLAVHRNTLVDQLDYVTR